MKLNLKLALVIETRGEVQTKNYSSRGKSVHLTAVRNIKSLDQGWKCSR
jgi:hypothetical protein